MSRYTALADRAAELIRAGGLRVERSDYPAITGEAFEVNRSYVVVRDGDQKVEWQCHERMPKGSELYGYDPLTVRVRELLIPLHKPTGKVKLTDAQRRALVGLRDHGDLSWHFHGQSAHGGLSSTIASLRRRELLALTEDRRGWVITDAGLEALG